MKLKKFEKQKKRKYTKPKLEDGNPKGIFGRYIKTNGKKIDVSII